MLTRRMRCTKSGDRANGSLRDLKPAGARMSKDRTWVEDVAAGRRHDCRRVASATVASATVVARLSASRRRYNRSRYVFRGFASVYVLLPWHYHNVTL
jgi:uncharacterized protein YdbL (DUF1318 family)